MSIYDADELPDLLTPRELRELYKIGRRQSYELAHSLGCVKVGRAVRVPRERVLAHLGVE